MMSAQVTTPEVVVTGNETAWNTWYNRLPESLQDIHLSYSYHRMLENNGDGTATLFIYREDARVYYYPFLLRPIRVKGADTGYFDIETAYGYSGPVSTGTGRDFLERASKAFAAFCTDKKIVTEFIRFHPLLDNHLLSSERVTVIKLRDYVYVDLQKSKEAIWDGYSGQNRNKIRKSLKLGIEVTRDLEGTYFDRFREIYLENMRSIHAARMYFFSPGFFSELKDLAVRHGVLLIARLNDEITAAGVFLKSGKLAHYFLASATPAGKQAAAGNLVLHEGILWAREQGAEKMHLGGGVTQDALDPLLVFKRNFSSLTTPFYIGKKVHDESVYRKLISDWDKEHPVAAEKYKAILQRYRWGEEDLQ